MLTENLQNPYTIEINKSQDKVIYGGIKFNTIIKTFIPFLLAAPLISYYMAVKKGQEDKFPHPTITDTACHYPQNIQFRFIMSSSGSFLSLLYMVLFNWVKSQKQRIKYPYTIYQKLYYLSQLSVWGFMIAMGTIDGAWYPDLHTNSAIFFFLMLFIIVITKTIVIRDMYQWDTSILSSKSLNIKVILGVYVALVWIYTAVSLALHPQNENDDENIYIVILEWNSVYICLLWVFSFVLDWKQITVTLSEYKKN